MCFQTGKIHTTYIETSILNFFLEVKIMLIRSYTRFAIPSKFWESKHSTWWNKEWPRSGDLLPSKHKQPPRKWKIWICPWICPRWTSSDSLLQRLMIIFRKTLVSVYVRCERPHISTFLAHSTIWPSLFGGFQMSLQGMFCQPMSSLSYPMPHLFGEAVILPIFIERC